MRIGLIVTSGVAAVLVAAACGGGPPPPPPPPPIDSVAVRDSIAREEAARRRVVEDSVARETARRERITREAVEDSLRMVREETEAVQQVFQEMIHFDFDRANIRPGDALVLDRKLAAMQANPSTTIDIVGHCDERGSDEYNIALGHRRALSAKRYLADRGIDESRITLDSRGWHEPLDPGHNEEAWALNRRDQFTITSGGDVLRRPSGM